MAGSYKNPPKFEEKTNYDTWKNEIKIWQLVTDLEKKKQALAVTLTLTGRARETALLIKADDLNKEDGMKSLLDKLDTIFMKEKKDSAYEAYKDFDQYKRSDSMSMNDYVTEFDQKYQKSVKYEMTLPDAVLAFKILESASLSIQERQLALTACSELKYETMRSALRRIFTDSQPSGQQAEAPITIKQESALFTKQNRKPFPRSNPKLKGTNPMNKYGKYTKCNICQSIFHWMRDCPHKSEYVKMMSEDKSQDLVEEMENCNITLFNQNKSIENEILVVESVNSAIIDTACTQTVCGEKWLNDYLNNINSENLKSCTSDRPFRFGDGQVVRSFKQVVLPAKIGKNRCSIETEVVKADIPLLLSNNSLKKADTILDLKNDTAIMFGESIKLQFTSSGHYCIDILDHEHSDGLSMSESTVLVIDNKMDEKEKIKLLTKLHKQFGHSSAEKLIQLLKSADQYSGDMAKLINNIVDECDICLKHKKPVPRPVVGHSLAHDYNQTVAVDLHQLEDNVWYLHIIDEFTRFSAGCITRTKKTSVFVENFIKNWISVHGPPKTIFSDLGGEFNSKEVRDMAENFNMGVCTTAAYSPWSNGLLERQNGILTEMVIKIKKEQQCDWEIALSWAIMAKNCMQNVNGFSPYQLVYGRNPNLPSLLTDNPPALEGRTISQSVADNITAMYASREAFAKAESSEKIRRALRRRLRPTPNQCDQGDRIYYKRPDSGEWRGPAVVIGQDGSVVFARHGGILVRVHKTRLRNITAEINDHDAIEHDNIDHTIDSNIPDAEVNIDSDQDINNEENSMTNDGHDPTNSNINTAPIKLKPGLIVSYDSVENNSRVHAKILSRAGKASGPNKNWYNLRFIDPPELQGGELSVDLSKVGGLEVSDPIVDQDNDEVLMLDDINMEEAKLAEINSWKQNNVFSKVEDKGQKCISTRWVCTVKDRPEGVITKARLVARGFEEFNSDIPKDSPTCAHESLRLVLSIISQRKWKLHSIDIKTAFLQGQMIDRDIYIKPPKEAKVADGIWKLNKCIYGLSDASLQWYHKVKEVILESEGKISRVDPTVFYWLDKSENVMGIMACHVDDFIWSGTDYFEENIISYIRSKFKIGKEDSVAFAYCGINLDSDNETISLNQDKYIDGMTPIDINPSRMKQKDSDVTELERHNVRSKVGQLQWIAHQSRPDLLFEVNSIAVNIRHATVKDILAVNKLIIKAKCSKMAMKYQHLGDSDKLSLLVFSDASLGNLTDGGSQGGYLILLVGEKGKFSPVWWNSRKIRRVVRSTLAAETLAMADAIDEAMFLSTLYSELTTGKVNASALPLICVTDCKSLYDAIKSNKFVTEKRLRLEISGVKELVSEGHVNKVVWFENQKQLADCLTKQGASSLALRDALNKGYIDI